MICIFCEGLRSIPQKNVRLIGKKPKKYDLKSSYLKTRFSLKKVNLKCYTSYIFLDIDVKSSEQVKKAISLLSYGTIFDILIC